jgi:hypothetical protein
MGIELESYINEALPSYLESAFWTSTGENDTPLDARYDYHDLDDDDLEACRLELQAFCIAGWRTLHRAKVEPEQCGHDFWLTRNRHGVGFWDRGLGADGDALTALSEMFGAQNLYVGDDDRVYLE